MVVLRSLCLTDVVLSTGLCIMCSILRETSTRAISTSANNMSNNMSLIAWTFTCFLCLIWNMHRECISKIHGRIAHQLECSCVIWKKCFITPLTILCAPYADGHIRSDIFPNHLCVLLLGTLLPCANNSVVSKKKRTEKLSHIISLFRRTVYEREVKNTF